MMNLIAPTTSYEPFSREPEYIEANRQFIQTLDLSDTNLVLDLACGTGALIGLILGERPGARVLGLDISHESLGLVREHLTADGVSLDSVSVLEASAVCLPVPSSKFDLVTMGNAIQLVDDKDRLAREAKRALRPGGTFAFSTSFYAGTYLPGTERVYLRWVEEALTWLRRKSDELEKAGGKRIARKRGSTRPAFSAPWLSAEEYCSLVTRAGFEVRSVEERTVRMTRRSFESIGAYTGLASVLLSGYPPELASEALQAAAAPTFAAFELEEVPRLWLEVVATSSA